MHRFIRTHWLRQSVVFGLSCLLILCVFLVFTSPTLAKKTLKVAIEPSFPPFELQGKDGKLDGFDVDLIKAIGKAANFEVAFQTMQFDGMIPALQGKTVDAAVAAMTITAERQKVVDFSRPYFKSGLAIAIKAGTSPAPAQAASIRHPPDHA